MAETGGAGRVGPGRTPFGAAERSGSGQRPVAWNEPNLAWRPSRDSSMAQSERATRSSSDVCSPPWRVRAAADLHRGADELARGRRAQVLPDAAGHRGALGLLQVEGQHQELRAADARHDVVLAERHGQGARHRLQRGVAGLVTEALVQLLDVAHIDEERVHRRGWLSANCNSWVPVATKAAPVWNPVSSSPRDSCSRAR